jgi:hypothetical protein
MTNESEDREYEIERQNELQAEKVRQQRIRDKVPGRRTNGKARAGDIDGQYSLVLVTMAHRDCYMLTSLLAILDQVRDEWDFIIDPDVRLLLHTAAQNDIITSFPNSSLIMLTWSFNYWIPLPSGKTWIPSEQQRRCLARR